MQGGPFSAQPQSAMPQGGPYVAAPNADAPRGIVAIGER